MQLIFGVIAAARWISIPHYIETLNPNWMIPCVGNLVVAFAAPIVDTDYTAVGWLWYGFGVVTFVPLFVLTIYRVTFKEFMGESAQQLHYHATTSTSRLLPYTPTYHHITVSYYTTSPQYNTTHSHDTTTSHHTTPTYNPTPHHTPHTTYHTPHIAA